MSIAQDKFQHSPRLLFLVATDVYFCSHRINLAKAAKKAGFEVAVATRCTKPAAQKLIEQNGIRLFPLERFDRSTINPYTQWRILKELYAVHKNYQPNIVHHVAIKAAILGTVIAKLCNTPKIINALGGLGYLFIERERKSFNDPNQKLVKLGRIDYWKKMFLRVIVTILFKCLFSNKNTTLVLQNQDDINVLLKSTRLSPERISLIPGAGIDTHAFPALLPLPSFSSPIIISCISRMLWDKGIGELVGAAKILSTLLENEKKEHQATESTSKYTPVKIILYGTPDPENPASIPASVLEEWHNSGIIEWRGFCEDVVAAYRETHIAVLPSYREGLPKSLLEAASCAKPIVTTNVPGCKEVVVHMENGLLVPPRNAKALAEALLELCKDEVLRNKMGQSGRKRIENYFNDAIVHEKTLQLYSI